jgi:hypothetical protein
LTRYQACVLKISRYTTEENIDPVIEKLIDSFTKNGA